MSNYGIITVEELKERIDAGEQIRVIDVREPHEYEFSRIEGAELKPLGQIGRWVDELGDKSQELILQCHHGMRSDRACQFLAAQGFSNTKNLIGGIDEWSAKIDSNVPRY